eukprot:6338335-Karenia_brevis.AAC.1
MDRVFVLQHERAPGDEEEVPGTLSRGSERSNGSSVTISAGLRSGPEVNGMPLIGTPVVAAAASFEPQ